MVIFHYSLLRTSKHMFTICRAHLPERRAARSTQACMRSAVIICRSTAANEMNLVESRHVQHDHYYCIALSTIIAVIIAITILTRSLIITS